MEQFLKNLWLWKAGLPETEVKFVQPVAKPALEELQKVEWNPVFEKLMRNRLIMGALRYGQIRAKGKPKYDRIDSMIKRLNLYRETGNMEYLVDVANLSLLEFTESTHPKQHWKATDDNEHVKTIK